VRSLQDACATLRSHMSLLLSDIAAAVDGRTEGTALEVGAAAKRLQLELTAAERELATATRRVEARLHDAPTSPLNLTATQLQRQLTSTAALGGVIRAVGTAQAALAQRAHREGAAIAARFLADSGGVSGATAAPSTLPAVVEGASGDDGSAQLPAAPAAVPCKVLKMGDAAMKRLQNGDIYKVCGVGVCVCVCVCVCRWVCGDSVCIGDAAFQTRTNSPSPAPSPHFRPDTHRASMQPVVRMVRGAIASPTLMCTRGSLGTTGWRVRGCTHSTQRGGELRVLAFLLAGRPAGGLALSGGGLGSVEWWRWAAAGSTCNALARHQHPLHRPWPPASSTPTGMKVNGQVLHMKVQAVKRLQRDPLIVGSTVQG